MFVFVPCSGGVTMVANVFFAHFWLQEQLSKMDLAGTGAILVGVFLIAAFADKSEDTYTLDELTALYAEPAFIAYAIFVIGGSAALYLCVKRIEKLYDAATEVGQRAEQARSSERRYAKWKKLHQFVYPTLSGVLGAQSVLFAKSTAELIKASFRGNMQWDDPGTYLIACCMFGAIFSQLHFLAEGLRRFDAVYVIPVFQCWFIVITILGGAVYFQEFSDFDATQAFVSFCKFRVRRSRLTHRASWQMFPLGVLVTLSGIVVLSRRTPPAGDRISRRQLRAGMIAVLAAVHLHRRVIGPMRLTTTEDAGSDAQLRRGSSAGSGSAHGAAQGTPMDDSSRHRAISDRSASANEAEGVEHDDGPYVRQYSRSTSGGKPPRPRRSSDRDSVGTATSVGGQRARDRIDTSDTHSLGDLHTLADGSPRGSPRSPASAGKGEPDEVWYDVHSARASSADPTTRRRSAAHPEAAHAASRDSRRVARSNSFHVTFAHEEERLPHSGPRKFATNFDDAAAVYAPADARRVRATTAPESDFFASVRPDWTVATREMIVPPPSGAVVSDALFWLGGRVWQSMGSALHILPGVVPVTRGGEGHPHSAMVSDTDDGDGNEEEKRAMAAHEADSLLQAPVAGGAGAAADAVGDADEGSDAHSPAPDGVDGTGTPGVSGSGSAAPSELELRGFSNVVDDEGVLRDSEAARLAAAAEAGARAAVTGAGVDPPPREGELVDDGVPAAQPAAPGELHDGSAGTEPRDT